jgi:uncharacterized protein
MHSTAFRAAGFLLALAMLLPLAALVHDAPAQAAPVDLVGWDTVNGSSVSATDLAANVTGLVLERGSGIAQNEGTDFNSNGWTEGGDLATAQSNNDFLEFGLTIASGFELTDLVVEFFGDRSNTGPAAIELRWSDDNFTSSNSLLGPVDVTVDGTIQTSPAVTDPLTGTVTFRIYGWGATGSAGTFDIETDKVGPDSAYGIVVSGAVTAENSGDSGQAFPLEENFASCDLTGWQIISVDADTANTWECSETFSNIQANGFDDSAAAEEWLITPPLNMDAQTDEILNFDNLTNFSDSGIAYPQLSVLYSSDYTGSGDLNAANWTPLSGINFSPVDSDQFVNSGDIDLTGISGDSVYFAFRYVSSGTGSGSAALWRLDSISFAVDMEPGPPQSVRIHEVQGDGAASPLEGQAVTVEAIVVGDFQDGAAGEHGNLGGFFIQEEDADADGDPATSEGLFIDDSANPVSIGDLVEVSGEVEENFGRTQLTSLSSVTVISSSNTLPATTAITLPVSAIEDFEAYENMLVTFPQELTISEYFNFDRFGEIVLALPAEDEDRPFQPTSLFEPGSSEATARQDLNDRSRITLDDGRSSQNPDPARHPDGNDFTLENRFRGGDTVTNATGVLDYSFSLYRIQPTQGADYNSGNPRPQQPADVGGSLRVVSFNVLNYFTTLDAIDDSSRDDDPADNVCGPSNLDCRGADASQPNEFQRQRDKIISALLAIDADIAGLIEIENNAGTSLQDLVDGLNAEAGAGTYAFVDTGTIGGDAIKVAFIYKPATVSLAGDFAVLDTPEFVRPNTPEPKNRPALAQTFAEDASGEIFTVVVNHFKSKGSSCGAGDDDTTTGQGNCNLTRTLAAQELVDWLASDPTGSGDPDVLIIGDLNAYAMEDPIMAVQAGPDDTAGTADDYSNLIRSYQGLRAYSYVFNGQFGYLDHALANAPLAAQVTGVTAWYINADEPDILDYDTSFKQDAQDALYEPNTFRSSDHDPVIIGLNLGEENGTFEIYLPLVATPAS